MDGAFRVGPWLAEPSLNTVSRNGTTVHLEPKQMEVLVCLAEHPGEPLSKEKLLRSVWPDTFVSDDVLIRSISELRRVFDDDAHESRFIQTIPKRGYRLVAPVVPVNATSGDHSAASWAGEPAHGGVRWGGRRWRIGALAVVGVVLLCVLVFALNAGGLRDRMLGKNDVPVIRSLAVLPLKNLSDDPAQKYFAYGMADELIADLSQISTLKVTSHTSVLRYENADKPIPQIPQIARELHVDAVVEGAVQRSGDRVHITAQLIYAPNDTHVWARSYDRDMHDVLSLESAVAREIADEIRVKMSPAEAARLTKPRTVNPQALDAYWKGRYHLSVVENVSEAKGQEKLAEDEFHQSLANFKQAMQLDPNYAPSYLGYWDAIKEFADDVDPHTDLLASGRAALMKALELDDSLAEAHFVMAEAYFYQDWNWAAAEKEYKRALALDPNSANVHNRYANYLDAMGRLDDGLKEHELQRQLDPDLSDADESPLTPLELQIERLRKRKFVETHQRAVVEDYWILGLLLARAGRYEEATDEWRTMMTRLEWTDIAEAMRRGYVTAGFHGALREWAKGLKSLAKYRLVPPNVLVYIYGTLGENNRAFAWLEKAYQERDGSLPSGLKVDPAYDPIRSDPRFAEMVHRVGLPP